MIKNVTTKATVVLSSVKDDKELFAVFSMYDGETIQFGDTSNKAQKGVKYSFEQLYELVKAVDEWRVGRVQKSFLVKAPVIEDVRQDAGLSQSLIQTQAGSIQQQVDNSLKLADEVSEPVTTFMKQGDKVPDAPDNIDLTDTVEGSDSMDISADSLGMSIESIARLGAVPETPPEFKQQLADIKKERLKKPFTSEKKTIKKNHG